MKTAAFVPLWLFILFFFSIPQASEIKTGYWEWYENQDFYLRQGIAEMAGIYSPGDPVKFIEELYAGFKKAGREQGVFSDIKLRVLNNDGLVEKIIFQPAKIAGWKHRCVINKKEIIFFFPLAGNFVFGIEEKMENSGSLTPSFKTKGMETSSVSETQSRKPEEKREIVPAYSSKPRFSNDEQPVP